MLPYWDLLPAEVNKKIGKKLDKIDINRENISLCYFFFLIQENRARNFLLVNLTELKVAPIDKTRDNLHGVFHSSSFIL